MTLFSRRCETCFCLCRTSCLETYCGSSRTATAGRSCGWSSPTSACSSTSLTRWWTFALSSVCPASPPLCLLFSGLKGIASRCGMSTRRAAMEAYRLSHSFPFFFEIPPLAVYIFTNHLECPWQNETESNRKQIWYLIKRELSRTDDKMCVWLKVLLTLLLCRFVGSSTLWICFSLIPNKFRPNVTSYSLPQDEYPLASLPLLGYSVTIPSETENIHKEYVFKLHFKSHVYYFRSESEYTFERYAAIIQYLHFPQVLIRGLIKK